MKLLFLSAAAVAALAAVPVLAQSGMIETHEIAMKSVTRAEMVEKIQKHFAKLDSDSDGFVTKAEAGAARDKIRERVVERINDRGDKMFDRLDSNNDGSISRSEFDTVHEQRVEKMRSGEHRMKRFHMIRAGMHGHLFEMADADKDGRVSIQEATASAAAHFDRADANRDGTLTADEMRAAHKARMGKAPGA